MATARPASRSADTAAAASGRSGSESEHARAEGVVPGHAKGGRAVDRGGQIFHVIEAFGPEPVLRAGPEGAGLAIAGNHPASAAAGKRAKVGDAAKREAAFACGGNDGAAERVFAAGFERGEPAEGVVFGGGGAAGDGVQGRHSLRQGAGLVEEYVGDAGESLQGFAGANQHGLLRGAGERGGDGQRGGEAEGAGTGDHEHREGREAPARGFAMQRPEDPGRGRQ